MHFLYRHGTVERKSIEHNFFFFLFPFLVMKEKDNNLSLKKKKFYEIKFNKLSE